MNWLTVIVPGVLVPIVGVITGYVSTRIAARDVHRRIKADLELHQLLPEGFDASRKALQASIDRQVVAHSKPYQGLTLRQRNKLRLAFSASAGLLLASGVIMFVLRSEEEIPLLFSIAMNAGFYIAYVACAAIIFAFLYSRAIYGSGIRRHHPTEVEAPNAPE